MGAVENRGQDEQIFLKAVGGGCWCPGDHILSGEKPVDSRSVLEVMWTRLVQMLEMRERDNHT